MPITELSSQSSRLRAVLSWRRRNTRPQAPPPLELPLLPLPRLLLLLQLSLRPPIRTQIASDVRSTLNTSMLITGPLKIRTTPLVFPESLISLPLHFPPVSLRKSQITYSYEYQVLSTRKACLQASTLSFPPSAPAMRALALAPSITRRPSPSLKVHFPRWLGRPASSNLSISQIYPAHRQPWPQPIVGSTIPHTTQAVPTLR